MWWFRGGGGGEIYCYYKHIKSVKISSSERHGLVFFACDNKQRTRRSNAVLVSLVMLLA